MRPSTAFKESAPREVERSSRLTNVVLMFVMDEHRSNVRTQRSTLGKIQLDGTRDIAVTVRNLSETGAMLEMIGSHGTREIPKEFTLHIANEFRHRNCRIVWLQPPKMGVRFL